MDGQKSAQTSSMDLYAYLVTLGAWKKYFNYLTADI